MASNFQMRVQLKGVAEIVLKAHTLARAEPIVSDGIRQLIAIGEATAKLNAPHDMDGLQRDIVSEIKPLEGRVHVIGESKGLKGNVVEYGRGAGKKQPPAAALMGWAARHGFGPEEVFVLARGIAARGIKGRFFMKKARTAVRRQMPAVIKQMATKAEAIWGTR